jgi:hypothetical protein
MSECVQGSTASLVTAVPRLAVGGQVPGTQLAGMLQARTQQVGTEYAGTDYAGTDYAGAERGGAERGGAERGGPELGGPELARAQQEAAGRAPMLRRARRAGRNEAALSPIQLETVLAARGRHGSSRGRSQHG